MNGEEVPAKVQSGDTTKYPPQWYKVEPVQWRVLNPTKIEMENAVLLSELALSANTSFYPASLSPYGDISNYARSDNAIRKYLTKYFYYEAFTSEEQAKVTGRNFAEGELEPDGVDGPDVTSALSDQKVWLPTAADYINAEYGFDSSPIANHVEDKARLCSPSDFALANFSYLNITSGYTTPARQSGGTVQYWTSSAVSTLISLFDNVYYVYHYGSVLNYGAYSNLIAARPALLFKL